MLAHTDCGMLTFSNDVLRSKLLEETGADASDLDFKPFADLEESVRGSLRTIRESPLLPDDYEASGWIYDVRSGRITEVAWSPRPSSSLPAPRVRVGLEVGLPPAAVGDVRVDLGRAQVGVAEHLLHAPQVGAALEQVRGEGVPQQVRVDALGVEPGLTRELADDQERARAGERAALRVEEELGPVAAVEVRPAARQVAAQRLDGLRAQRDDALLVALADAADERGPRGRRPRAPGRPPRSRAGRRRRGARSAPGRECSAASSRSRPRSGARPRRARASAAAGRAGAAGRPRPRGCPCGGRARRGGGRRCARPRRGGRPSSAPGRGRAGRRATPRSPRRSRRPAGGRGARRGRRGRGGRRPPSAARGAPRGARGTRPRPDRPRTGPVP